LAYCTSPWMKADDHCGTISGMNEWQGKPIYSEKTCSSAALSSPDPTRVDPRSIPGRRGGKPPTNRMS
jgi:hypothetical protein